MEPWMCWGALYNAFYGAKKEDIGTENTYPWNVKP
jgi:hypothetical protein